MLRYRTEKHTRYIYLGHIVYNKSLDHSRHSRHFFGKKPESGIPTSNRATRRYTKVHLGFCLRFSTPIGQIGRVPLFGAVPRRYIRSRLYRLAVTAFWRTLTASWRTRWDCCRFICTIFSLVVSLYIGKDECELGAGKKLRLGGSEGKNMK